MLKLKEASLSEDNYKIISCLRELGLLSEQNKIDKDTFEMLIGFIKVPNAQIINLALSILAKCCSKSNYCTMFKEMGGVPHLLLVVKNIEDHSIIGGACKLIVNLSFSADSAMELCKNNVGVILKELLEKQNVSSDTLLMVFRTIRELWRVPEFRLKRLPDDFLSAFSKCLNSDKDHIVRKTIETLLLITRSKNIPKKKFMVSKEFFLKIIEVSKKEALHYVSVLCLSNFICNLATHVWIYLEGSNIAEIFIEYLQKEDFIDGGIYKAFYKLCTEGAIRNKVRIAGLLPRLIEKCNAGNVEEFLAIIYLFQFDLVSMTLCSQNPKFTSILINNIFLPGAVPVLTVLSRLNPPIKELVTQENLDVIIKNKECIGILKNISRTREFLQALLTSGRIWEIEKAGCSMEEVGSLGHSEGLIIQLLSSDKKECKENVSLAIPFLVKPRNFELLYKLLARYQVITTILGLLQENPEEERILASVIRLINIFRYNYLQSETFFQGFGETNDNVTPMELTEEDLNLTEKQIEGISKNEDSLPCNSDLEIVTFELDNGSCVDISKSLLCKNSPVLDSMLNGHFIEAQQEKVRLQWCSQEALLFLEKLLREDVDFSQIKIETYLELISLTDRFLLTSLNNTLTENLKIDRSSCALVYQWCRKAGYTKNNTIICKKVYEFLFSSSEYLVLAMKNNSCRGPLVKEITNYLSNSLIDLL